MPTPSFDGAVMACSCLVLLLLTASMHYEALRAVDHLVPCLTAAGRARVLVVILTLVVAHLAQAFVYAAAYYVLSRHPGMGALSTIGPPSFNLSWYFSLETYSSLGYGDIVPSGHLRMMAGAEALNGLLLVGWSASYAHIAMDRLWRTDEQPSPRRLRDRSHEGRSRPNRGPAGRR
jgi:hypothetical protein